MGLFQLLETSQILQLVALSSNQSQKPGVFFSALATSWPSLQSSCLLLVRTYAVTLGCPVIQCGSPLSPCHSRSLTWSHLQVSSFACRVSPSQVLGIGTQASLGLLFFPTWYMKRKISSDRWFLVQLIIAWLKSVWDMDLGIFMAFTTDRLRNQPDTAWSHLPLGRRKMCRAGGA